MSVIVNIAWAGIRWWRIMKAHEEVFRLFNLWPLLMSMVLLAVALTLARLVVALQGLAVSFMVLGR